MNKVSVCTLTHEVNIIVIHSSKAVIKRKLVLRKGVLLQYIYIYIYIYIYRERERERERER